MVLQRYPTQRKTFGGIGGAILGGQNASPASGGIGGVAGALLGSSPDPIRQKQQAGRTLTEEEAAARQAELDALPTNPQTGEKDKNVDYSQNYYGKTADRTKPIERVGQAEPLAKDAFKIAHLGEQRKGLKELQGQFGALNSQAMGSRATAEQFGEQGMQNALQSRALALGALTAPGPSAAEGQLLQGQEAAARNALAMARSGRGFGSAGQMRSAQFAGQEALGNMNQQAAILRAQEEAARRQQLLALGGLDLSTFGAAGQQQAAMGGQALQALGGTGVVIGQQGQLAQAQQQAMADRAKFNAIMAQDINKTNANFANYTQPVPVDNTMRDWGAALGGGAAVIGAGLGAYGALKPDDDPSGDSAIGVAYGAR